MLFLTLFIFTSSINETLKFAFLYVDSSYSDKESEMEESLNEDLKKDFSPIAIST